MLAILALIAMSHASTPQQEPSIALPEEVTCSDLFWHQEGNVNPKELTDKQKCWLSVHQGETNSGLLAGLYWIRVDGEYFSVSAKLLQNSFNNEEKGKLALQVEFNRQYNEWKRSQ